MKHGEQRLNNGNTRRQPSLAEDAAAPMGVPRDPGTLAPRRKKNSGSEHPNGTQKELAPGGIFLKDPRHPLNLANSNFHTRVNFVMPWG